MNAITVNGWLPKAKIVFKSNRKTDDYHGQMNLELFQKWFVDKLIPNIPERPMIIMDNASYHNTLASYSPPTPNCSKNRIHSWLRKNKISCKEDCLKVELVEILNKIAPEPIYEIDIIAQKYGHKVILNSHPLKAG